MVRTGVGLCCILAMCLSAGGRVLAEPATPLADPVGVRVRGATPQMTRLIEQGVKRSRTFADLVQRLNKTSVIVYVQATNALPLGVNGQLTVTPSAGTQRYLRAQVVSGLNENDAIAVIAHELQHATEVAEHEEVRDTKTLAELYAKIGVEAPRGRYDTMAAQAAGTRVRAELG